MNNIAEQIYRRACQIADQREWGDIEKDPVARRYYDTAVACIIDAMNLGYFDRGLLPKDWERLHLNHWPEPTEAEAKRLREKLGME